MNAALSASSLTSSHPHILTSAGDRHDDIPRSLLNRRSLSIENATTNLTMPVGIGGVGDIIAIIGLVNQFASALDGSRGSAAEYQEVRRELEGLEQALLCHHQLLQARCNDPGLDAIFTSSQKTAEDCKKCIEAFSQQTVKFDRSLGVGGGGNVCRDVTMKVRWQMSKKAEVVRFRAELAQHIASLNMLFALANINLQRDTQDKLETKMADLEDKLETNLTAHQTSITELREDIADGTARQDQMLIGIQEDLKLGWLRQLGAELKEMVSEIFTVTGTTLSAVRRIEETLASRSDMTLNRSFLLEDALGRMTRIDMLFVSSWDAFDNMLEGCFRAFPGHQKVARKEYLFQDQKTSATIGRAIPWSGAFVPGQCINMGLVFTKRSSKTQNFCPFCHLIPAESQADGLIPCKCGMSHQRITQTMNINEGELMPSFDLAELSDLPSPDSSSVVKAVRRGERQNSHGYVDMSSIKRIFVVAVEMNIIRPTRSNQEATEADARRHRIPAGYDMKHWKPSEEPIMLLGSVFDGNALGEWIYDWTVNRHGPAGPVANMAKELWLLIRQLTGRIRRMEECMARIRTQENRDMIDNFIESGDRLMDKLQTILKSCESLMIQTGETDRILPSAQLSKNAGIALVDSLFRRDHQLEVTENWMTRVRLWELRCEANCGDILQRPGQ